jgi:hypothetical protein
LSIGGHRFIEPSPSDGLQTCAKAEQGAIRGAARAAKIVNFESIPGIMFPSLYILNDHRRVNIPPCWKSAISVVSIVD